jgi:putative oxidoreductase
MNVFNTTPSERQVSIAVLVLRVALGIVFVIHGGQKLFVMGPAGTAGMLGQMGIPGASFLGPVLSVAEPLAGVGLLVGLLTRAAALWVAADMLGAILTFHLKHGFFVPGGIEFPMMLVAPALALILLGAGRYSVDHAIDQRRSRA